MNWLYIGSDTYTCVASSLNIDSQGIFVEKISGRHVTSSDNDDVQVISIKNSVCEYLPTGFEKFFKNVEGIAIVNSKLKAITMSDLRPFPKLRNLWLPENCLKTLEGNLFAHNPQLKVVNFHNNYIETIASGLFTLHSSLEHVYLDDNVCIESNATDSFEMRDLIQEIKEDCQGSESESEEDEDDNDVDLKPRTSTASPLRVATDDRLQEELASLKRSLEDALNFQNREISSLRAQLLEGVAELHQQNVVSKAEITRLSETILELHNKTEKLQADVNNLVSDHDKATTFWIDVLWLKLNSNVKCTWVVNLLNLLGFT